MSWQQALQDKGCESKSQGTKEEKPLKRQAPAPRRDREAQEAGGTMNVEKTGKGSLPTRLAQSWLTLVLEGRLLSPDIVLLAWSGRLDMELGDPSLPILTPGTPSSRCCWAPAGDKQLWPAHAGVEFPCFFVFSPAPVKRRARVAAAKTPLPAERGLTPSTCVCGSVRDPEALGREFALLCRGWERGADGSSLFRRG